MPNYECIQHMVVVAVGGAADAAPAVGVVGVIAGAAAAGYDATVVLVVFVTVALYRDCHGYCC
jgi:hypothetical protein